MNIATRLCHRLEQQRDATAIIEPDTTEHTYADIDRQSQQIAAWLTDRGITSGDRVAIYLPDTAAYLPAIIGIWRTGAVASPINTRFGIDELEYTLSDLEPAGLVASDVFENNVTELCERISSLEEEMTLLVEREGTVIENELPAASTAPEVARRLDDDPAVVMYTSGTTGRPKGVIQTHRNVGAQLDVNVTHFDIGPDDVSIVAVPLFHVGGLYGGALPALLEGATIVVQPMWDAATWAELVETYDGTFSGLIPTMMVDALTTDAACDRDTSSLEQVVYGGSPATEDTLDQFQSIFEVGALRNYYGQTENTGLSVTYDVDTERRPGLLGRPVHAVKHRVVDIASEELTDVEPGEEGELLLRGDIITPGYWDSSLDEDYFSDGWLHTDDAVSEDEDGLLYYVDRVDDMIISGGENVAPSEVENALQDHPDVEAVAVFGTDHERWGEAVTAGIIPADLSFTEEELLDWWSESAGLAGYKKPRRIEFVEKFPRTATQKIDKASLRERIASNS